MSSVEDSVASPRPENYALALVSIGLVIAAQIAIPARDRIGPPFLVPAVEGLAFLIMLGIAAKPGPVPARARPIILVLFGLLATANAIAAVRLVVLVLGNGDVEGAALSAERLLVAGVLTLATNVVTFGLLYWQLDGGGPARRVVAPASYPDFQFPQTATPGLAAPGWQPHFMDHLYLAYTNVVAFSPTDAMPLTHRAKGLMVVQSMISLGVLVVVLARVINILPA